jgi:hypothetical protein
VTVKRDPTIRQKYRNGFPAYRVFIFGMEVTKDTVAVRIRNNIGRQPNSCTVELINKFDRYMITRTDMEVISQYLGGSKDRALAALRKANINALDPQKTIDEAKRNTPSFSDQYAFEDNIKSSVVSAKLDTGMKYSGTVTGVDGKPMMESVFPVYPWKEGRSIFHPGDPVRVFLRDPFNPVVWWYGFAGFVTDQAESTNENKDSMLSITIEDVTRTLRYARIGVNPAITDVEASVINENKSTNLIDINPGEFTNPFADFTFFEIVESIFFGVNPELFAEETLALMVQDEKDLSPETFQAVWGKTKDQINSMIRTQEGSSEDNSSVAFMDAHTKRFRGISVRSLGKFTKISDKVGVDVRVIGSPIVSADQIIGKPIYSLKEWQNLVSHQVLARDLTELKDPAVEDVFESFLTPTPDPVTGSVAAKTIIDIIGANPSLYPVEGKVRMLVPANLGQSVQRDVLDRAYRSNFNNVEYFDRLNVLFDAAERIDFVVSCTPRGDILIEMPLYDFDPDDFGSGEQDFLGDMDVEKRRQQEQSHYQAQSELDAALNGDLGQDSYKKLYGNPSGSQLSQNTVNVAKNRVSFKGQVIEWEDIYTILPWDTYNWSGTESDEKVKTVMMAQRRIVKSFQGLADRGIRKPVAVVLRNLVPVYGIRIEQGDPYGFVVDEEAARVFCLIKLNRMNADALSVHESINARFGANLNRPYLWVGRNHIFTATSLSHSIVWNSSCETEISGNYCRGWEGQIDSKGRDIYTPIGGTPSRPLNYALLSKIGKFSKVSNDSSSSSPVDLKDTDL